jgi:5-methylcytosine-specific restriction endonuclease McrA
VTRLARPCLDCGQPTRNPARCPACAVARERHRDQQRGTSTQRGYDAEWRAFVAQILDRDERVCHWCGGHATTGDHVVPLSRGGPRLDPNNVVAACLSWNSSRGGRTRRPRRFVISGGPRPVAQPKTQLHTPPGYLIW